MGFFQRLFPSRESKMVSKLLDEVDETFDNSAFPIVREKIERVISENPPELKNLLKDTNSSYEWVYSSIANVAGDMLESGQYHMYRGVLNPTGYGPTLLELFDVAVDELVKLRAINQDLAQKEKSALRKNLNNVG